MMIISVTSVSTPSVTHLYTGTQQEFDVATGGYVEVPAPMQFSPTGPYLVELNNELLGNFPFYVRARHKGMNAADGNEVWEFDRRQGGSGPVGFYGKAVTNYGDGSYQVQEVIPDPEVTCGWQYPLVPGHDVTACELNLNPHVISNTVVHCFEVASGVWRFQHDDFVAQGGCGISVTFSPDNVPVISVAPADIAGQYLTAGSPCTLDVDAQSILAKLCVVRSPVSPFYVTDILYTDDVGCCVDVPDCDCKWTCTPCCSQRLPATIHVHVTSATGDWATLPTDFDLTWALPSTGRDVWENNDVVGACQPPPDFFPVRFALDCAGSFGSNIYVWSIVYNDTPPEEGSILCTYTEGTDLVLHYDTTDTPHELGPINGCGGEGVPMTGDIAFTVTFPGTP